MTDLETKNIIAYLFWCMNKKGHIINVTYVFGNIKITSNSVDQLVFSPSMRRWFYLTC